MLVPKSSDELLNELDPRFFTESFDAVAFVLVRFSFVCSKISQVGSLTCVPDPTQENLPDDRVELDMFLQTEISAVDLAKDAIVARLADDVRANYNAFIQGMKHVEEVDLDIVRALIQVKNGRRLLFSAKQDLILISFFLCALSGSVFRG